MNDRKTLYNFIVICFGMLAESVLCGYVIPLLPGLAKSFGVSASQIGIAYAAYPIALMLTAIPMGYICDRYNRHFVFRFGFFALSISAFSMSVFYSYPALVMCRTIQGIAAASIFASGLSHTTLLYPPHRHGVKLGIAMSLTGVGYMLGPAMGGLVTGLYGVQFSYAFIGALMAAFWAISLGLNYWVNVPIKSIGKKQFPRIDMRIAVSLITTVLAFCGVSFMEINIPFMLDHKFSLGVSTIGLILAGFAGIFIITQPLFGKIYDRGYKLRTLGAGYIWVALTALLFTYMASLYLYLGAVVLLGIGFSMMVLPCLPLLSESVRDSDNEAYGIAFGAFNVAFSFGVSIGPVLGGIAYANGMVNFAIDAYCAILIMTIALVVVRTRSRSLL